MDRFIYVSEAYMLNLGPLGPLLHVEKFVVVGGGWVGWWVDGLVGGWCVKRF